MENMVVTTVGATGVAETDYDIAHFHLSTYVDDDSAPLAKLRLKERVDEFERAITEILKAHEVSINKGTLSTLVNVAPRYEWQGDRNNLVGYRGTYTYTFQTSTMDKVSKIYDEFASVHNVTVVMPTFSLKDSDALNKKALQNGWQKICERFADQCDVFGVNPNDYDIVNWQVDYSDMLLSPKKYKIATTNAAPQGLRDSSPDDADYDEKAIDIVVPTTKVSVALSVSFKKK